MCNELFAIDDADLHRSMVYNIAPQAGLMTTGANSAGAAARLTRERSFGRIRPDLSLAVLRSALAEIACDLDRQEPATAVGR
jgi:hypothetical protein